MRTSFDKPDFSIVVYVAAAVFSSYPVAVDREVFEGDVLKIDFVAVSEIAAAVLG